MLKKFSRSEKIKYLKPGALAHVRNSKAASKSCMDLGKKRVSLNVEQRGSGKSVNRLNNNSGKSPKDLSPVMFQFAPVNGPEDASNEINIYSIPSTPCVGDCKSESRLESLPVDLLVKIICHLHHDQLRAVFHVSRNIRKAVIIAREFHFNYTTPDRSSQEMLNTMNPLDHWPFMGKRCGKGARIASPPTPKAPKRRPLPRHQKAPKRRPPPRHQRQITPDHFQESCSFTSRCLVTSVLQKLSICIEYIKKYIKKYISEPTALQ